MATGVGEVAITVKRTAVEPLESKVSVTLSETLMPGTKLKE